MSDSYAVIEGSLDHIVVAVKELAAARRCWARLGFNMTSISGHPEFGTRNSLAAFGDSYLELLWFPKESVPAVSETAESARRLGEGLLSIALKTDDAKETARRLSTKQIALPVVDIHRPVREPQATGEARFSLVMPPTPAAFSTKIFFCQHHTPELVWHCTRAAHPNGACGLGRITLVAHDLAAAADYLTTIAPTWQITPSENAINCSGRGSEIVVLTETSFRQCYGRYFAPSQHGAQLAAVVIEVASLAVARSHLQNHAVGIVTETDNMLVIPPHLANGILLSFVEKR